MESSSRFRKQGPYWRMRHRGPLSDLKGTHLIGSGSTKLDNFNNYQNVQYISGCVKIQK